MAAILAMEYSNAKHGSSMKSQHDGHLLAPASPNIKSKKKHERNSEPPQRVEKRGLNSGLYTQ